MVLVDSDRLISLAEDIDAACRLTGEFTVRSGQGTCRSTSTSTCSSPDRSCCAWWRRRWCRCTCRLAEGADVGDRTVVLIEDVITTGGAVRAASAALWERGSRGAHGRLRHRSEPGGVPAARRHRHRCTAGAHPRRSRPSPPIHRAV